MYFIRCAKYGSIYTFLLTGLNQVESQVTLTQNNVEQINLKLPEMLVNATKPLVLNISRLRGQIENSLETFKAQLTNDINDLEQRLNRSNNELKDLAGSKY